jgi:hypothetical protein
MNLSSKEMARLIEHIGKRVEINRYRLTQKTTDETKGRFFRVFNEY